MLMKVMLLLLLLPLQVMGMEVEDMAVMAGKVWPCRFRMPMHIAGVFGIYPMR